MRETVLRLAIKEEHKRKTDPNETHERSIIILGSKGVVSNEIRNVLHSSIVSCISRYISRVRLPWCIGFSKKMKNQNLR